MLGCLSALVLEAVAHQTHRLNDASQMTDEVPQTNEARDNLVASWELKARVVWVEDARVLFR